MSEPDLPLRLHVRCLRPACGREALVEPASVFARGAGGPVDPRSAPDLAHRFVCRCGARAGSVSWVRGRPRPDNPCGWL